MPRLSRRHLPLEACFNLRDIGGYRGDGGRMVRWGRYYRSGRPDRMTGRDRKTVERLGLRTQLDLRNSGELQEQEPGDLGGGSRRRWLPLLPDGASETLNERFGPGMSGERYLGYLSFNRSLWLEAFRCLADPSSYPVLVHCVAGKDRTGVLTALVLSILGVDRGTIEADYLLTNEEVPRLVSFLEESGRWPASLSRDELVRASSVPPGAMRVFLEGLEREYGGAEGYLRSIGLGEHELASIRANLLEEAGSSPA